MIRPRVSITKSKAGHYTLTIRDEATRLAVSRGHIGELEWARSLVPALVAELEAAVASRPA